MIKSSEKSRSHSAYVLLAKENTLKSNVNTLYISWSFQSYLISSALVICKVLSFVAFFQGISCCYFTKHVLSYVVYRKHLPQSCEIFIWSWFNWVSGISRENYPCAVNRKSCVVFPEEEEEELLCSVIWTNNCINFFQDISLQAIPWHHKR